MTRAHWRRARDGDTYTARLGVLVWELAIIIAMAMNLEIAFAVTQRRFDKENKG